jgi:urease accessory protein
MGFPTRAPQEITPWHASLELRFARQDERTALVRRAHQGPLQVQKALYPEGPDLCHVTVLHPPGGIAAGDRLDIAAELQPATHAVLTTPGATKWYRSTDPFAAQTLRFDVGAGSVLEWLPRESILFEDSRAELNLDLRLTGSARFLGWEILCFGRRASGEGWRRGRLRLSTRIRRDDAPVWCELADVSADHGFADSLAGLDGCSVSATLLAAGCPLDPELLQRCRDLDAGGGNARSGLSWVPGVLVARFLGHSSEQAFQWFTALWTVLRPALLGRPPRAPRLWAC